MEKGISGSVPAVFGILIALLTFDYQPLRFEAHETQRAGLLVVLVVAGVVSLKPRRLLGRLSRQSMIVVVAIFGWYCALVLATLTSLSPTESLFGDAIRRMGLLTHLCFLAIALMAGVIGTNHSLDRWFWLSGIVVSSFVVFQFLGIIDRGQNPFRPSGILGLSVFTAGWLSLAWTWIISTSFNKKLSRSDLIKYAAGLGLIITAIVLTSSRGASVALLTAGVTLLLLRAAYYRQRRLAQVTLIGLLFLGCITFITLNISWNNSVLSQIPLLYRLNISQGDVTLNFRKTVWMNTMNFARKWPLITSVYGDDSWSDLRSFIGYGLESFELVYRQNSPTPIWIYSLTPIDRAHNDWLDTLITTGWIGVISRLTLYFSIGGVALARLKMFGRKLLIPLGGSFLLAAILGAQSPYLPVMLTFAVLIGLWLWLAWRAHRPMTTNPIDQFDTTAGLALCLLVVHVAEIQFNFVTITTGLTFWLSVGLLISTASYGIRCQSSVERESAPSHLSAWVGLAGSLMIRSLLFNQGWFPTLIMLSVIWLAARTLTREISNNVLIILLLWLFGLLGAYLSSAELAAAWDVSWVIVALVLMGNRLPIRKKVWLVGLRISLLIIALWWWGRDIAAYIHAKQGLASDTIYQNQMAVMYNGWDIFLRTRLSDAAFSESVINQQDTEHNTLNLAITNLATALELKPYDAYFAWRLAYLETQRGNIVAANFYYAAAVHMWPTKVEVQQ